MAKKEASTVHRRLASGVGFFFVAQVFAQGSTLIANILLARAFSRELFGQYSVVLATLTSFATISLLSMSSVVTKFLAEYRQTDIDLASRSLSICSRISNVVGLAGMLFASLFSGLIARLVLGDSRLATPLLAGAAFVFFQNRSLFLTGVLVGLEEYRQTAIAGIISGVSYVALVFLGARLGSVAGATSGLSLSGAIFWLALIFLTSASLKSHGFHRVARFEKHEKELLYHFAVPAIASGLLLVPGTWWLSAFLYRECGPSAVAVYNVCTSVRIAILFVPMVISSVATSVLNNSLRTKDYALTQRLSTLAIVGASAVLVGLVALFGSLALQVFGHSYTDSYPILLVLAASTVAESFAYAQRQRVSAHRLIWSWFLSVIVPWQVITVGISLYAIPKWGAMGAAVSYAAGAVVLACASWILCLAKARRHESLALSQS